MSTKPKLGRLDTSSYTETLERVAAGIDVALHDPNPLTRLAAQTELRDIDTEFLLMAARHRRHAPAN